MYHHHHPASTVIILPFLFHQLPIIVHLHLTGGFFFFSRKTSTSPLLTTPKPLTVWITTNCGKFFFFFFAELVIFFILFFKLYFIFKLYNIVLVLPKIEMNPPQVYLCSPSWTLLRPPSPYPPSGSSQCTSPKHPVSCIKPGLATRFIHDIIHVSMPFSQISPPSPSPSPTESIRLIYTSV